MSAAGANSAPNSAASNISSSQSPLQLQQQQMSGISFPSYQRSGGVMGDDTLRVKSPSALSNNSTTRNELSRASSNSRPNTGDGYLDPSNAAYTYHQQQRHHNQETHTRGMTNPNNPSMNPSPFQQYNGTDAGYPSGAGMEMGIGPGMEDMIGKWIDGVGGGLQPSGLNGALGNIGSLSSLAAAAGFPNQSYGNMSPADRQAWLAKSIFGGHQSQGQNEGGLQASMGAYSGSGQVQQQYQHTLHEPSAQDQRGPDSNAQLYGMGMQNAFSAVNPGFHPFMAEAMYANPSTFGLAPQGAPESAMGQRPGEFDTDGINAALAGIHLAGYGEQGNRMNVNMSGRPAGISVTGANAGPPSTSSGRGSLNSNSAPGSALSQLSGGSAGTGITSFSSGSGGGVAARGQHSINVNSVNGRAMIGALLDDDKDFIPTAIVIKNIPFDVVKEKMLEVILSLGAPLPYAFNYHYENNQFRGLAFANFRQPFEADSVVAALNGYDLFGRKLRVEYKKVLQVGEKERIEKEKAIRRMKSAQLRGGGSGNTTPNSTSHPGFAQQQRPGVNGVPAMPNMGVGRTGNSGWFSRNLQGDSPITADHVQYAQHPSMNSRPSYEESHQANLREQSSQSESPPSSAGHTEQPVSNTRSNAQEYDTPVRVDHTDPWTFDMHTKLVMFMADRATDETTFSSNLSPQEKKVIHALAERLGLQHSDVECRVIVGKQASNAAPSQALGRPPARGYGAQPGSYLHPHSAAGPSLRNRTSMPNLNGINAQSSGHREPSRLLSRQSTQNLRDFSSRSGQPHSAPLSQHPNRRTFVSSGPGMPASQGFNSIFGSSMGQPSGSALDILPSPTSPSDPTMQVNLTLPSRGFAANRASFRSRHGSTESARNAHASGVIGSQRPSSVTGMAPLNSAYRPDDRSGHTSGSSVIAEEDISAEGRLSLEA